jgi:hypothetical protein
LNYGGFYASGAVMKRDSTSITMMILFILMSVVLSLVFWMHSGFCCYSCYISHSRIHGIGADPLSEIFIIIGLYAFFQNVFADFKWYFSLVRLAVIFLLFLFWSHRLLHGFFTQNWVTLLFFGNFLSNAFNYFYQQIVVYFLKPPH